LTSLPILVSALWTKISALLASRRLNVIARRAVFMQKPGPGTHVLRSSGRRWCRFDKGTFPVIILSLIRHASIIQFSHMLQSF
jgi:hypothetical protein